MESIELATYRRVLALSKQTVNNFEMDGESIPLPTTEAVEAKKYLDDRILELSEAEIKTLEDQASEKMKLQDVGEISSPKAVEARDILARWRADERIKRIINSARASRFDKPYCYVRKRIIIFIFPK